MTTGIARNVLLVVMVFVGLLFVSNIYVLGNREAAIEMHEDLAPWAGNVVVQGKVIKCFAVGILYLTAAYGIVRGQRHLALAGIIGTGIFIVYYFAELLLWGGTHERVWLDFGIFGGVCLLIGVFCWLHWRKRGERKETGARA